MDNLVSFSTDMTDTVTLATTGVTLLSNGITSLSKGGMFLTSPWGEVVTDSFIIANTDDSLLADFTYTLVNPLELPITITTETIDDATELVLVTYSPTITERESCKLLLDFGNGSFFGEVVISVVSVMPPSMASVSVTPSSYDFGDIAPEILATTTITITCNDAAFSTDFLSVGVFSIDSVQADINNFAVDLVNITRPIGDTQGRYLVSIMYIPQSTVSSNVLLTFYYNQSAIGAVTLTGNSSLVAEFPPLAFEVLNQNYPAPQQGMSSAIYYENTTSESLRITECSLVNDTFGEYAISNMSLVIGAVLAPEEYLWLPITYTPKTASYTPPVVAVNYVSF